MPPETAAPIAGTNTTDTGTAASTDTLLTAAPATAQGGATAQTAQPAAEPAASATDTAGSADKPTDGEPQGAPEQYADFTLPEGMAFNDEVLGEFKAMAKERNLSQEDAQKFTDLGAKLIQQSNAKTLAAIESAQAQWLEQTRTDKEYGGDHLAENMAIANKALTTFGTPELTKLLTESKLGNHPEVIRAFFRVGKAISEDKLVAGTTKPAEDSTLKKLYPTIAQN